MEDRHVGFAVRTPSIDGLNSDLRTEYRQAPNS